MVVTFVMTGVEEHRFTVQTVRDPRTARVKARSQMPETMTKRSGVNLMCDVK